jgi:hypothetical protein
MHPLAKEAILAAYANWGREHPSLPPRLERPVERTRRAQQGGKGVTLGMLAEGW